MTYCEYVGLEVIIFVKQQTQVHVQLPMPSANLWLCRASIPVFTCLLSIAFERKVPTKQEGFALLVLTLGVMIAMWRNNAAGSPFAIGLCLIGTICNAGMMSMSGRVLSEKVDALQLAFYTAPVSFSAIMPVFLYREVRHLNAQGNIRKSSHL